jgi:hypothetical protein
LLQIVGQSLLIHDSIFLVTDNYDTVVRVQVNSAKLHLRASFGLKRDRTLTLAPPLPRGEEARQMIIIPVGTVGGSDRPTGDIRQRRDNIPKAVTRKRA